jgi:hypothetical protein
MALELDVFVLCRRDRRLVDSFLDTYADQAELAREHPPRDRPSIVLEPPLPPDAPGDEVALRTQREAVELGLAHPGWAFVHYLAAAPAAPTDQCCVAFTRDAHAILGLTLVDPGSAADDGRDVDPVAVLERLVADHDAVAGLIGWEITPFGTAPEFEAMLRGERVDGVGRVRLDLPRWLRGRWL